MRVVGDFPLGEGCDASGVSMRGEVNGPAGFLGNLLPTSAPGLTLGANRIEFRMDRPLPPQTAYLNPIRISWRRVGSTSVLPEGDTLHRLHIFLAKPLARPSGSRGYAPTHLTAAYLATKNAAAINQAQAIASVWSSFSTGSGPANVKTWDARSLRYYGVGAGGSVCGENEIALLSMENGECASFAGLMGTALAAHGIGSARVDISAYVRSGNPSVPVPRLEGQQVSFVVRDWNLEVPARTGDFQYFLSLPTPGSMVPEPINRRYGDFSKLTTIPGQNTAPPSESLFLRHFILVVGANTAWTTRPIANPNVQYFDPSYGVTYAGPRDFEAKALEGYARQPQSEVPPPGYTNPFVVHRLPRSTSGLAIPRGWICFTWPELDFLGRLVVYNACGY